MCNNSCSGFVSGMVVSGPKGPDHFIALLPVFQILHSLHFLFLNEPSSLTRELIQMSYLGDSTPQSIMFLSCLRYKYRDFLKQFHMSQLTALRRSSQCSRFYLLLFEACVPCQSIQKICHFLIWPHCHIVDQCNGLPPSLCRLDL